MIRNSDRKPKQSSERQWVEDDGTPIIEIARREGVIVKLEDEAIATE